MIGRRGIGRRGPGVVGMVARTAVIAGTASAVHHGVERRMDNRDANKQQEAYAEQAAVQNQADMQQMQAQLADLQAQQAYAAMQAQQAPPPPAPVAAPAVGGDDLLAKLQQLTQLKEAGALSDDEFAAAKARLLA